MLYIDHVRVDLYFDCIYFFFILFIMQPTDSITLISTLRLCRCIVNVCETFRHKFIMQPTDSITLISTLRLCRCIVNVCETFRHSVILNYALDETKKIKIKDVWHVLYKQIKSVSVPNY